MIKTSKMAMSQKWRAIKFQRKTCFNFRWRMPLNSSYARKVNQQPLYAIFLVSILLNNLTCSPLFAKIIIQCIFRKIKEATEQKI